MTFEREDLAIEGVALVTSARIRDERGFVAELTHDAALAELGLPRGWVQDNFSLSPEAPTLRGLHFQLPPHAQGKLVRILRGAAYTVAVDLREGSPTYGRHVGLTLASPPEAFSWDALYVPPGFAHGLVTLEPETEVFYKLSAPFAAAHARGLAWDDPDLGIDWPVRRETVRVSPRDRGWPGLRALGRVFPEGMTEHA